NYISCSSCYHTLPAKTTVLGTALIPTESLLLVQSRHSPGISGMPIPNCAFPHDRNIEASYYRYSYPAGFHINRTASGLSPAHHPENLGLRALVSLALSRAAG